MPFTSLITGPNPFGLNAMAALAQRLSGRRLDPYPGFNFLVEIDGLLTGGFSSVRGLEAQIEYKQQSEGGSHLEYPVVERIKHAPLVLSHGLTDNGALWKWFNEAKAGLTVRRRTVSVMMLDAQQLPITWWYCVGAVPTKWIGPSLDAASDAVAVEQIELEHQGLRKGSLTPLLMLARAGMQLSSQR